MRSAATFFNFSFSLVSCRLHYFLCFLSALFFLATLPLFANEATEQQAVEIPVIKPTPQQVMEVLPPDAIALKVGEMSVTWKELRPLVQRSPAEEADNAKIAEENYLRQVKMLFQRLTIRSLLLQEARARNITVTEEEKQAHLAQLQQGLTDSAADLTVDGFLATLESAKESTLLTLTVEDAQKVVKLGNQLFALIKLKDEEIEEQRQKDQGVRNILKKQNEARRKDLQLLLQEEEVHTDAGFAKLARRYSEGTESRQGGELDMNFTREQLAEVNHLDDFLLQVGETSKLMETPTAFRIMRVLREVPPENPGEESKLRVAQLLFKKHPDTDITFEESRQKVLVERQRRILNVAGHGLTQRYPVQTPIFPDGLW